jgi:predicted acetyltransferase
MPSLELHPASPEERLAAYRNVHDVWGAGLPIEQHVERRLASVKHNRADLYVGCLDGRVVTSLAAYPLEFHYRGDLVPGCSIGSVHTHAEYRGRGYAAELIDYVETVRREEGERIALLYSDIACDYYARLGYVRCPAWQGSRRAKAVKDTGPFRVEACSAERSVTELLPMYQAYHGRQPIAVARSAEYWRHTLDGAQDDTFMVLLDSKQQRVGYARLRTSESSLRIVDFALTEDKDVSRYALLRFVLDSAAGSGLKRVSGWLPGWPEARALFDMEPRRKQITMLKALDDGIALDKQLIASAHVFCEIDHV